MTEHKTNLIVTVDQMINGYRIKARYHGKPLAEYTSGSPIPSQLFMDVVKSYSNFYNAEILFIDNGIWKNGGEDKIRQFPLPNTRAESRPE